MSEVGTHILESVEDEKITEWARGIVTGSLMIADIHDHAWQTSLSLMIPELAKYENLGQILVPRDDHLGMPWINNVAPGCTMRCFPVAREDCERLGTVADQMWLALHPEAVEEVEEVDGLELTNVREVEEDEEPEDDALERAFEEGVQEGRLERP